MGIIAAETCCFFLSLKNKSLLCVHIYTSCKCRTILGPWFLFTTLMCWGFNLYHVFLCLSLHSVCLDWPSVTLIPVLLWRLDPRVSLFRTHDSILGVYWDFFVSKCQHTREALKTENKPLFNPITKKVKPKARSNKTGTPAWRGQRDGLIKDWMSWKR